MLADNLSQDLPVTSLWQNCLSKIQHKVGPASYETWFRTTDLKVGPNGDVSLLVPNQFFADFIEEHFSTLISEVLKENSVEVTSLSFVPTEKDWKIVQPLTEELTETQERKIPHVVQKNDQFHPNYRFESYVVGDSNRMAHAAALAVAEAPGKTTFNPLIIYGGTGLGKTHLLQAIGHFAQTEGTADNVVYLTSEEFTNQYINYVVNKKDSTSFYKKFSDVDLLLIDDIQFFSGKPGTQKEFFRIFNKLLLNNKQIVLSSDRQPDKIPDMMDHIINRFMGGLNTDIQPPNLETRIAILRKKAETDGLILPEEVLQYIAGHITSNVRELEGTLIKLIASSSFTGRDITLDVAKQLCGDAISSKEERLSIKFIQQKTAEEFSISANQFAAHTRKKEVALPRSVAMYLCKKWTRQSLRSIGLEFGGRDYSTVIHSFKKIEAELEKNNDLKARVNAIEQILEGHG
ncbi:chromosomal replication initiator protein DnaA [Chitinispirillales bacterium ANBcel5]|uniref:chromosomal replication initiator protein DnaA n=1 Tax=Cellulosispirillum alkaliphilum TaxID=3039283 RepID=UPI002A50D739|nr:chromosomal replication initiator protein DnaA [Chitinispirillales bacterium ANBcel5]